MKERKHESDGHPRLATHADIKLGTVLRRYSRDGGLHSFADHVVIGIRIQFDAYRHNDRYFDSTDGISELLWKDTIITLARPYLYANPSGSSTNWLVGVEKYETTLKSILATDCSIPAFSVVEMSTGEPDCRII